jgi:hypothetical protein
MQHGKKQSRSPAPPSATPAISSTPIEDPLCLDDPDLDHLPATQTLAPATTGLSEEEDAVRQIDLQFNPHLLYCINCEVTYDVGFQPEDLICESPDCPRCFMMLERVGTKPLRTNRKHTK